MQRVSDAQITFSNSSAGPETSHSAAGRRVPTRRQRGELPRGGREESCPEAAERRVAPLWQAGVSPPEHKIGVFVRFCPPKPSFSSLSSTNSAFLCAFDLQNPRFQAFRAQNRHFCAREAGDWHQGKRKLASGSITMAFPQITAHVSKTQTPHNQTINF